MSKQEDIFREPYGLPPCGGSGLKFLLSGSRGLRSRLPPCGGSGLKYSIALAHALGFVSPSMRREWIEIFAAMPLQWRH